MWCACTVFSQIRGAIAREFIIIIEITRLFVKCAHSTSAVRETMRAAGKSGGGVGTTIIKSPLNLCRNVNHEKYILAKCINISASGVTWRQFAGAWKGIFKNTRFYQAQRVFRRIIPTATAKTFYMRMWGGNIKIRCAGLWILKVCVFHQENNAGNNYVFYIFWWSGSTD